MNLRLVVDDEHLGADGGHKGTLEQVGVGGDGLGQADQDAGALSVVDGAGGGDAAVHGLDEPFGDGETEAGPFGPIRGLLHTVELVEHSLQLGGRDALPLILD